MKSRSFFLFFSFAVLVSACGYLVSVFTVKPEAATHDVTMTLNVLEYINFDITSGSSVSFGDLTPGTPIPAPDTGTICSVTTNAANGYTLAVHDGATTTGSALLNTDDSTTRVTDYAGTITTPTAWTGTGLGVALFASDSTPEAKWCAGTCTTYDDADNKYAGIPETATIAHTVTGFHASADTSSWAFKVDVPNTQKTGAYSGSVTFTALAVLS